MPTTYPAAVSFDALGDLVTTASTTAYDVSTFTVGVLCKPETGFSRGIISSRTTSGGAGWYVELDPSAAMYMHWSRDNNIGSKNDSCGSAFTLGAWNWIFFSWNGSRFSRVRSGLYGSTLVNRTVSDDGGTFNDSVVGQSVFIGGRATTAQPSSVAFMGVWSGVLSDAIIDAYAADMDGNGGTTAAIEYFKFRTADKYGVTGGKLGQVGTYTSVILTAGPDGNTYPAAAGSTGALDKVVLGSSTSYDVATWTVGILYKLTSTGFVGGTLMCRNATNSNTGWEGAVDAGNWYLKMYGTAVEGDSFGSPHSFDVWTWAFISWDGTVFSLRSGPYGGTLVSRTRSRDNLGSGANSLVGLPWTVLGNTNHDGTRPASVAFAGMWSGILADATIDAYAANMETSGGLTSAIEYFKFKTTDTAGVQGGKIGLGGSYTTVSLVAGPNTVTSVAALRTRIGAAVTGR